MNGNQKKTTISHSSYDVSKVLLVCSLKHHFTEKLNEVAAGIFVSVCDIFYTCMRQKNCDNLTVIITVRMYRTPAFTQNYGSKSVHTAMWSTYWLQQQDICVYNYEVQRQTVCHQKR